MDLKKFFDELWSAINLPEDHKKYLEKNLQEIIIARIVTAFINDLPETEKQQLQEYVKTKPTTEQLTDWFNKHFKNDEEEIKKRMEKIDNEAKLALQDFFKAFYKDLKPEDREKIKTFLKKYQ